MMIYVIGIGPFVLKEGNITEMYQVELILEGQWSQKREENRSQAISKWYKSEEGEPLLHPQAQETDEEHLLDWKLTLKDTARFNSHDNRS